MTSDSVAPLPLASLAAVVYLPRRFPSVSAISRRRREVGIAGTSAMGLGPPNALVRLGGHERRVAVDGPGTAFARARRWVDDARRIAEVVDRRELLEHAAVHAVAADAGRRPREVVRPLDDAVALAGEDPSPRAAGVEGELDAVGVLRDAH